MNAPVDHDKCSRNVPMMELQAGACKWPVNDAAKGEQHLFCGLPADGSYCEQHRKRAYYRWVPA